LFPPPKDPKGLGLLLLLAPNGLGLLLVMLLAPNGLGLALLDDDPNALNPPPELDVELPKTPPGGAVDGAPNGLGLLLLPEPNGLGLLLLLEPNGLGFALDELPPKGDGLVVILLLVDPNGDGLDDGLDTPNPALLLVLLLPKALLPPELNPPKGDGLEPLPIDELPNGFLLLVLPPNGEGDPKEDCPPKGLLDV
jgi:hypothetical protein